MEENKKPETTSQQDSAPADYSRYMGTLNRIYPPQQQPQKEAVGGWHPLFETGAKAGRACQTGKRKERPQLPDHARCGNCHHPDSVGHQKVLNHTKNTARNDLPLSFRAVWQEGSATVDVKSGETIKRSHSGMQQFLLMRRSHPHPQP